MRILLIAVSACLWLSSAPLVSADQTDPRLDGLFQRLQASSDAAEAKDIEGEIWTIWVEVGNDEARKLMALGLGSMRSRAPLDALRTFELVVFRAPDYAEGYNKRALIHFLLGNHPDAISDIERTLELEPRHFGALAGLGFINLADGDLPAAIDAFERALAINPHMKGMQARIDELRGELKSQ